MPWSYHDSRCLFFSNSADGLFFSKDSTCTGTTLAANSSCTIKVAFTPTATGAATGTATITASVTITGSPVALTGAGISCVRFSPTTWTPS